MKIFLILMLICMNAFAGANYSEPALRATPVNMIVYVPWEAPTVDCRNVAKWDATHPRVMALTHRTLDLDMGEMPDMADGDGAPGRLAPHMDGGYIAPLHDGYPYEIKRTQRAAHEQQLYVDPMFKGTSQVRLGLNPFEVNDSILSITANRTPDFAYGSVWGYGVTSGMIGTQQMYAQRGGYIEASIRLPEGKEMLPAFWLLPYSPVQRKVLPEFDIMEAPGNDAYEGRIAFTSHWMKNGRRASYSCTVAKPTDDKFHTYGILMLPDRVVYYLDRLAVAQVAVGPDYAQDFYIIANLAVGGDWVGFVKPSDNSLPQSMEIDYIAGYTFAGKDGCAVDERGVKICR